MIRGIKLKCNSVFSMSCNTRILSSQSYSTTTVNHRTVSRTGRKSKRKTNHSPIHSLATRIFNIRQFSTVPLPFAYHAISFYATRGKFTQFLKIVSQLEHYFVRNNICLDQQKLIYNQSLDSVLCACMERDYLSFAKEYVKFVKRKNCADSVNQSFQWMSQNALTHYLQILAAYNDPQMLKFGGSAQNLSLLNNLWAFEALLRGLRLLGHEHPVYYERCVLAVDRVSILLMQHLEPIAKNTAQVNFDLLLRIYGLCTKSSRWNHDSFFTILQRYAPDVIESKDLVMLLNLSNNSDFLVNCFTSFTKRLSEPCMNVYIAFIYKLCYFMDERLQFWYNELFLRPQQQQQQMKNGKQQEEAAQYFKFPVNETVASIMRSYVKKVAFQGDTMTEAGRELIAKYPEFDPKKAEMLRMLSAKLLRQFSNRMV